MDKSSDRESKSGQLCCVPRCNNRGFGHIWPMTPLIVKAWKHVVDYRATKFFDEKIFVFIVMFQN